MRVELGKTIAQPSHSLVRQGADRPKRVIGWSPLLQPNVGKQILGSIFPPA